jgi:hypothetical protein
MVFLERIDKASELRVVYVAGQLFTGAIDASGSRDGAVDWLLPPRGEPVFLEVDPGGEWGMLERELGLPIPEAIAQTFLDSR